MEAPAPILEKLAATSTGPGVYLMKDTAGIILYVGKAGNLKRRISSYFARPAHRDPKTDVLVSRIAIFETILTATEHEALVLESNLIKRHKPRYNVVLKDGKRYPSLRIDLSRPYPCLEIVRKVKKDGARYFGPFTSVGAARESVGILHKTFRIRRCRKPDPPRRDRPCLNYQMGHCLGPCCLPVDPDQYQEMIQEAILFLKGRTPSLLKKYQEKMNLASEKEEYERAAEFRDKMFAIKKTLERQVAVTTDFEDRDVAALVARPEGSMITMLHVRGGFLVGSGNYPFLEAVNQDRSLLQDFLLQFYEKDAFVPPEVLVSEPLEDAAFVEDRLGEARGGRVRILVPLRGEKARLADMARQNATDALERRLSGDEHQKEVLARLGKRLRLPGPPGRLECFDISHTRGSQTVASRVVFSEGAPDKNAYRRYKVRDVAAGDDYGAMRHVLSRRFDPEKEPEPLPDLLLVDGGKGQLSMAMKVLAEMNLSEQVPCAGIAKKEEERGETEDKIYLPGQANPVMFGRDRDALMFLSRVRDEAHRFAITLHRSQRGKTVRKSVLDGLPGIGEKRKKALLRHFKSVARLREATEEDLAAVPGMNRSVAQKIRAALAEKKGEPEENRAPDSE